VFEAGISLLEDDVRQMFVFQFAQMDMVEWVAHLVFLGRSADYSKFHVFPPKYQIQESPIPVTLLRSNDNIDLINFNIYDCSPQISPRRRMPLVNSHPKVRF